MANEGAVERALRAFEALTAGPAPAVERARRLWTEVVTPLAGFYGPWFQASVQTLGGGATAAHFHVRATWEAARACLATAGNGHGVLPVEMVAQALRWGEALCDLNARLVQVWPTVADAGEGAVARERLRATLLMLRAEYLNDIKAAERARAVQMALGDEGGVEACDLLIERLRPPPTVADDGLQTTEMARFGEMPIVPRPAPRPEPAMVGPLPGAAVRAARARAASSAPPPARPIPMAVPVQPVVAPAPPPVETPAPVARPRARPVAPPMDPDRPARRERKRQTMMPTQIVVLPDGRDWPLTLVGLVVVLALLTGVGAWAYQYATRLARVSEVGEGVAVPAAETSAKRPRAPAALVQAPGPASAPTSASGVMAPGEAAAPASEAARPPTTAAPPSEAAALPPTAAAPPSEAAALPPTAAAPPSEAARPPNAAEPPPPRIVEPPTISSGREPDRPRVVEPPTVAPQHGGSPASPEGAAEGRRLNAEGFRAYQRGDVPAARALYRQATDADPDLAIAWFNLACVASLESDVSTAAAALARYHDLAPDQDLAVRVARDKDFDPIRADPAFKRALRALTVAP